MKSVQNKARVLAVGICGLVAAMVVAQDAPKSDAPTTAIDPASCVTADCHPNIKQHKVLHGPTNVDACDACHKLVDELTHKYEDTRPKTEMCTFCHQVETEGAKVIHEPLTTGECMGCHDPHGGFDRNTLRSQSMNDFCKTCHEDVIADKQVVHGPAAAGTCGACHLPHTSELPKLLMVEGRDLCLSCHTEMAEKLETVTLVHEPVNEQCTACHNAHASDHMMMLASAPSQLCTEACHEEVKQTVTEATHKHSAVTEDQGCANCHTSHGSDLASLMIDQPIKTCLKCHNEEITIDETRVVAAVTDMTDDGLFKHGPVQDGQCGGCHNVHGSENERLLVKPYSGKFYEPFALDKYDLCFECHDPQLVLLENTSGLTDFRNGDHNLHFTHVNRGKRGRNCRACHTTHASTLPVQVRKTVPYGNWLLPINYTQTETGGTCKPGCHKPFGYDRDQAVVNEVEDETKPTTPAEDTP